MMSNLCNEYKTKEKHFTTKLSLPKFMSVVKKLTLPQRNIVQTLGFHDLLDLSCAQIPKSVVLFLVRHFDVSTRRLLLPAGYTLTVTSLQVHQVLGTSIGGFSLSSASNDINKKMISQYIKCSGKYPTINELMDLITPDLEGDKFKMIFTLFLVTCFLCPTSSESSSQDFCSLISKPDQIAAYDWSGIVLDKLVDGIHKFQQSESTCGVSALSGCVFVLMSVPRLKFWTTEIVNKFSELDAINEDIVMFGRKPMKDISLTPFSKINLTEGLFIDTKLDVQQILNSILPGEKFHNARLQLQATYDQMWENFVKLTRPTLIDQIVKTAEIIKSNHSSSSFFFSRNFDSQCKLPRSTNLCQSIDKVVHRSSIPNQESKKSVQLSTFEFLRIPEVQISDNFLGYDDIFYMVTDSLCEMRVEQMDDIYEFPEPILEDFLVSVTANQCNQAEPFGTPQSISELTSFILSLEPTSATPYVIEPKENMPDIKLSIPAQASSVMPLKKRPICVNLQKNSITEESLDKVGFDGPKKKLKFGSVQSDNQRNVSSSHQECTPDNVLEPAQSNFDDFDDFWTEDTIRELDQSVTQIENMRSKQSAGVESQYPEENSIPCKPLSFKHTFISIAVEKAVHQYIVSNIPGPHPARSPRIIKILKQSWVDHRTFGLSMQVYGSISVHVMNIMGVSVMEEQFHKHMSSTLPSSDWCKYIFANSVCADLQDPELVPTDICF